MLKDKRCFALLLANKDVDLLGIVQELALKYQIRFNRAKLDGDDKYSYVLYTKSNEFMYIYNAVRNKNIRFLWKSNSFFGMINCVDDSGLINIIYFIKDKDIGAGKIEGDIVTPNLKPQFKNMKKVQLVSSKQLDEEHPYEYEHFCFYLEEILSSDEILYKLNNCVTEFYHKQLLDNTDALEYLKSRNINNKTIDELNLGYASKDISLYDYLVEYDYAKMAIFASKLVKKKDKSNTFVDRIIFPIINEEGQVVSFGGRTINDDKPKYINGAETLIYSKDRNIYGINISKDYAQDGLIIVEGYFDYIALYQAGIKNVVALLGTAISDEQIELIKRYTNKVTLILNSDLAGQRASLKIGEKLKQYDIDYSNIKIKNAKDVDKFINKYGIDEFKKLLQKDDLEA